MIEINMDKINKDSAIIMLSSLIQSGRCDRICIFESGEESDYKPGIRHAIERAFTNGNYEEINKYFGNAYSKGEGKPTNKEFIAMLTELIKEGNSEDEY